MSAFQRGFSYSYLFLLRIPFSMKSEPLLPRLPLFLQTQNVFHFLKKIYCYECGENAEKSTSHVVLKFLELFRGLSMLVSWLAMSHNPFSPIELALRPRFVPLILYTKKKHIYGSTAAAAAAAAAAALEIRFDKIYNSLPNWPTDRPTRPRPYLQPTGHLVQDFPNKFEEKRKGMFLKVIKTALHCPFL